MAHKAKSMQAIVVRIFFIIRDIGTFVRLSIRDIEGHNLTFSNIFVKISAKLLLFCDVCKLFLTYVYISVNVCAIFAFCLLSVFHDIHQRHATDDNP